MFLRYTDSDYPDLVSSNSSFYSHFENFNNNLKGNDFYFLDLQTAI